MRLWLLIFTFLLGGCESHQSIVARCVQQVEKAQVRCSHTSIEVPTVAQEALARARLELEGTHPIRACHEARQAVKFIQRAEQVASTIYVPVPTDLDYGWGTVSTPSRSSSSSHSARGSDSGAWSGRGGFGGSDSGGWSGGGSSGGSDSGAW